MAGCPITVVAFLGFGDVAVSDSYIIDKHTELPSKVL
jgi:hypothetical protein